MDKIIIFTDGGVRGNGKEENVGGYGAVLIYVDNVKYIKNGEQNTTNNIQELKSVINSLYILKSTSIPVEVYSDSAYVVNGITSWVYNWENKGWKTSKKKPVENKELWQELKSLVDKQNNITFHKVKGHSNVYYNEVADTLANEAMDELEQYLKEDTND